MKRVGVVVDSWKLSIFERRLDAADIIYSKGIGPIPGSILLQVDTDDPGALAKIVLAANTEAAGIKRRSFH